MINHNLLTQVNLALEAGEGILQLKPTWVPRSFVHPGRRMKLSNQDLYVLGAQRGGIDERWFASTVKADNGPGTPPDEGLSYVLGTGGDTFLLRDAIDAIGVSLLGKEMYSKYRRWPVFCKFFDNMGPIPHHLHQKAEHVQVLGRESKPEAYYFPRQMNSCVNHFPYTFFGLHPGTTKQELRKCLECWNEGDNGILDLASASRLKPGTGWLVPPGILHAPGSLCTYEVQWASDVLSMFQNIVEDRYVPWDLVVKDVPEEKQHDLDYLVELVDWEANVDPHFKEHHYLEPILIGDTEQEGWQDRWVIYGKIFDEDMFAAKELTVKPGASCSMQENGACGVLIIQGKGEMGPLYVESPTEIRYGEVTNDEFFVAADAARAGVRVANTGKEPLVVLRYFGPGSSPDMPQVGDYRADVRTT